MNGKLAKQLRREARQHAEAFGVPTETQYNVLPKRVQFAGAQTTLLRPMNSKRIERLDRHRDFARAQRAGVTIWWLLSETLVDLQVVRPQVVLAPCVRQVYQQAKRLL